MVAVPKSIPAFVRRVTGAKGKTIHYGRGFAQMQVDNLTSKQLLEHLQAMTVRYSDIIDRVVDDEEHLIVHFSPFEGSYYYRTIMYNKKYQELYNLM